MRRHLSEQRGNINNRPRPRDALGMSTRITGGIVQEPIDELAVGFDGHAFRMIRGRETIPGPFSQDHASGETDQGKAA